MTKNVIFDLIYVRWSKIWASKILKNWAWSGTCHNGQLLLCTISEKTNDPILRKVSDGRTDRRKDRQTDERDFIGRRRTNIERPIINN